MKTKVNIATKVVKGLLKVSLVVTLCLFLLFFFLAGAIQVPYIQNYLVTKVTEIASDITEHKVTIEGIHIDWFDIVVLEETVLWDNHNNKMIYLGEAEVDYTVLSLMKGSFYMDNITLRDGEVNLVRYKNESTINISEFIWKVQELTTPKVKRTGPPVAVEIPQFTLDNMLFSYNDKREPFITEGYFDHNHFTLDSIHGRVTNLYAILDTIRLTTHHLRVNLRESHLKITELNTHFLLDKHQIECSDLYVKVSETIISDYFQFYYKDINDLSDFNEKTDITVRLKESNISIRDLAHFAPALKGINDHVVLTGEMKGRINRFSISNLAAYFGKSGRILGRMRFDGLPNIQETFMDINLTDINVHPDDISPYTGKASEEILEKFGNLNGKGEFLGLVNDFAVTGAFDTGLGSIVSDVNLKINSENDEKSYYKGAIKTKNFNLGKLLGFDFIQNIDMDGEVEGKGLSLESVELDLAASIYSLGLYGYNYKNIITNAVLSKEFFNGEVSVKDSNLVMNVNGKVDLKVHPEEFIIVGSVEKAKLTNLNLSKDITNISSDFSFDFNGTEVDSILGKAILYNTKIVAVEKEIDVAIFELSIDKEGQNRKLDLSSEVIDLSMKGNFLLTEIIGDLSALYKESILFYNHDKKDIQEYYATKPSKVKKKYSSEFDIKLKSVNHIVDLFYPGLYISKNSNLTGVFSSGSSILFNVFSTIDSLYFKGNEFYNNTLDLSISKLVDSSNVLATCYFNSKTQNFTSALQTENIMFEGQWFDDKIDFRTFVAQKGMSNRISLNGNIVINEFDKRIIFKNSHIDILDERWNISDSNSIDFDHEELIFNFLKLKNEKQTIVLMGDFSPDAKKQAYFYISNFNLSTINPLLSYKLGGVLDGHVKVRDIYNNLDLTGSSSIKKFAVDDFDFGNIDGVADWDKDQKHLNVNVDVIRDHVKTINITGNIKPPTKDKKEELNLLAKFSSADLGVLSPVLKGVMSDIKGSVDGNLKIMGNMGDIRLKGDADVKDGKFKIDYLGTTYTFSDKIYFTEDQIRFRNLGLKDIAGNDGKLNGSIAYDGFKNFLIDVKGDFKNFNVLSTTEKDNSVFYGTTYATGNFSIFGPFEDLTIRVNAKSDKETRIYIPLTGESDVSQKEFIKFIPKPDSSQLVKKDSVDNFRLRMFFNMEITPDAYAEIIFDKRAGDIIRGRGEGNIDLRIDTKGDISMYGNYMFKEGRYNFTMAGIVNKEFIIDKESRISWNGDILEGTVDIKAKYNQTVSLKPLFDTTMTSKPDLQRNYPTDVVLSVKGNLLSPTISMDIDILRYPTDPQLSTVVTDFENKIKTNEFELNRQVFSLIMLRSFTSPNSFSGVSSVGTSTVSELFSSQLSHFLSQVDQNLEVNVNLKNMDKDALNTFNLRLSYTALDGKLRISRDGNFQNVQASSQANISNIAGEWTVEYMLSNDGNLRVKLFNRINNNALVSSTGNVNTSAGASIMHIQSFNNLKDIFGGKKKRREEELNPKIEEDISDEIKEDIENTPKE